VEYEAGKHPVEAEGATTAIQGILTALDNVLSIEATTQDTIKQVIKEKNLKKG